MFVHILRHLVLQVKQDDTVKVGQELANVGAGSGMHILRSVLVCSIIQLYSMGCSGAKKSESKPKDKSESKPKDKGEAPTASAPVEDDKQKLEEKPISEEPMGGEPSPKDTASSSSSQPESLQSSDSSSRPASASSSSDSAPPQPGSATGGPSIRFPRRVTPDGKRISDLPADEQDKYRKQDASSAQQQAGQQAKQPQASAKQAQKPTAAEPNKFVSYAGQDRGTKLSQARVLTAKEIEIIELGGADP